MSTWPNRGGLRRPLRGLKKRENQTEIKPQHLNRPQRSDSSQQASSKPGVVHLPVVGHVVHEA